MILLEMKSNLETDLEGLTWDVNKNEQLLMLQCFHGRKKFILFKN